MPIKHGGRFGKPRFRLAAQHDGTAVIMTHDVERVLADIDAGHGDCGV
jgi:hypothetical protein